MARVDSCGEWGGVKGDFSELEMCLEEAHFHLINHSEDFINIVFDIEIWFKEEIRVQKSHLKNIEQRKENLEFRRILEKLEKLRKELRLVLRVLLESVFGLSITGNFQKLAIAFVQYVEQYTDTIQEIKEETTLLDILEIDYAYYKRNYSIVGDVKFEAFLQLRDGFELVVPFYLSKDDANDIYSNSYLGGAKISYLDIMVAGLKVSDLPISYIELSIPEYLSKIHFYMKYKYIDMDDLKQFSNFSIYDVGLG